MLLTLHLWLVLVGARLATAGAAEVTLCAAFPGACDGTFAGGAIVVENNATVGGTIPTEMGQLTGLQEVRLMSCRLSGTVPSEVGRLTALRTLIVGDAPFSGTVAMYGTVRHASMTLIAAVISVYNYKLLRSIRRLVKKHRAAQ